MKEGRKSSRFLDSCLSFTAEHAKALENLSKDLIFINISLVKLSFLKKGILASGVVVLGIDEGRCEIFVKERGKLRKQGTIIGDFDLLIASV